MKHLSFICLFALLSGNTNAYLREKENENHRQLEDNESMFESLQSSVESSISSIFTSKDYRQQNEPCSLRSQCAPGLTCFSSAGKMGPSSCQPSFTVRCFREAFSSIRKEASDRITEAVNKHIGFNTGLLREPDMVAYNLTKVAFDFKQELVDYANEYNKCALNDPEFRLLVPKDYFPGDGKNGISRGMVSPDRDIFGFQIPIPMMNLGLSVDMSALLGGVVYGGLTLDVNDVNFRGHDLFNLTVADFNLPGVKLGGFVNLCLGINLGANVKNAFSGGLAYNNLTDTEYGDLNAMTVISGLQTLMQAVRGKTGTKNMCTSFDVGAGVGLGGFFCGLGIRQLIQGWKEKNYFFELGGSSGMSIGGGVKANRCNLHFHFSDFSDINPFANNDE